MNEQKIEPIFSLEHADLRVRDRRVLRDVTWQIGPAQHWAIIGPNGAGKTSLAGALRGVVPVVGGRITYRSDLVPGQDIGYISFEKHRREIEREDAADEARSFSHSLQAQKSARHFLADTHDHLLRDAGAAKEHDLIAAAGLADLLDRPIRALSMGEMRKLLLIREVLSRPRLLILDEPFDGLDAAARQHFGQVFETLVQADIQLILITHRLDEMPSAVSHIMGVRDGRIQFCGPRQTVANTGQIDRLFDDPPPQTAHDGRLPRVVSDSESIRVGPLVQMKNVTVRYGSKIALNQLDWTMHDGENWAVVGPNGSGKTTLLRMIAADHPQAYANEIYLFGRRRGTGESIWEIKRNIGWISAEFQIQYRKTIKNVDVVMSGFFDSVGLYRQGSEAQRASVRRCMNLVGMSEQAQRPFTQISHGEQRRVLIARAMVKSPLLLILDEPCQGLDPAARGRILRLLDSIGTRTRTNLIYVTHHPDEWLACLTHVLRFEPIANGIKSVQAALPELSRTTIGSGAEKRYQASPATVQRQNRRGTNPG